MSDLFTIAELADFLGKGTAAKRHVKVDEHQKGADFAKQLIHGYTGREFVQSTYTDEVVRQNKSKLYKLKHRNVSSITSVTTDFLDTASPGETVETKYIERYDWGFRLTLGYSADFFLVTYVAGESSVPEDIKEVAMGLAKRILIPEDRPSNAVMSMSADGVNYQFQLADWTAGKPTGNDYWDSILNSYAVKSPKYGSVDVG